MAAGAGPMLALAAVALVIGAAAGGKKRRKPTDTRLDFPDEPVGPNGEDIEDDDAAQEPEPLPPVGISQWPKMAKPSPIAVGFPDEPDIAALLIQMEDEFAANGVDLTYVSAEEATRMPKAPGQPVAIPPMEFWQRMAQTLRETFIPLRLAFGAPLSIRGYRPADYNEAVGGTPGSRHQWFEGIDVRVVGGTAADKRRLAMMAAQMFVDRGNELQMGFGVYGKTAPSVHFDTGYDKRTWRDAQYWLGQLGIAGRRAIAGARNLSGRRLRVIAGGRMDARTRLMIEQARRRAA